MIKIRLIVKHMYVRTYEPTISSIFIFRVATHVTSLAEYIRWFGRKNKWKMINEKVLSIYNKKTKIGLKADMFVPSVSLVVKHQRLLMWINNKIHPNSTREEKWCCRRIIRACGWRVSANKSCCWWWMDRCHCYCREGYTSSNVCTLFFWYHFE